MFGIESLVADLERFLEAATAANKWRVVRPLEAKLQKAMRHAFTAQGAAFLRGFESLQGQFSEALAPNDWLHIFDQAAAATYTMFLDPLQATAAAGLTAGATNTIAQLGLDIAFNLKNPRAVQYMHQHGAQNVSGINDTTRSYLNTVLTQAVDEGWSYQRTAKAIKDRYAEFAVGVPQEHIRSRAELIAVTESGNSYEAGSAMPVRDLQDAGLKMEKSWLTVGDNRVDPHCADNAAQGWIPFDEPFSDGSMQPLSHPACRCTALYRRAPG
jgi:uncharacterized protein with gpF-like domain